MGVPGLTTFVEDHRHILQDVRFRSSRLVIDGCSLYFRLYFNHFLDQQHGGDYDAFAALLHQFFSHLATCDIQPFVVLDGGVDPSDKKFDTMCYRLQCRIKDADGLAQGRRKSVLPALTRDVFVQVLYQRGVPLVQCPFEADSEIACLAYQWQCPVLTNDSDFYIFDLPGGYLPLTFFQWSHLKGKAHQKYISARSYTTARLCRCFGNMNQRLLPLCAVLNGNDYCTPNERLLGLLDAQPAGGAAGKGKSGASRIQRLLHWLSSFAGVSEALEEIGALMGSKARGAGPLISHLLAGMEDYRIDPQCNLALWFSGGDAAAPWEPIGGLPEALWLAVAQALLPSLVVDAAVTRRTMLSLQVENCRLPSGNVCAQPVRQAIYGILLGGHAAAQGVGVVGGRRRGGRGPGGTSGSGAPPLVDEYDRLDLKLQVKQVEAVAPRTPLPLDKLHQISAAVRRDVLLEVLQVQESSLAPLPVHLKLPVAATAFWLRNAKPAPSAHQLQALLLFMVYGELSWNTHQAPQGYWAAERHLLTSLDHIRTSATGRQGFDIGAAHSFSQWQSCLKSSMYLNQLLLLPLPEPRLPCLYSGTLVHVLHRRLKGGQAAEALLGAAPLSCQLYCTLLAAARNRSSKPQPSASTRGGGQRGRGRGRGGRGGGRGRGRGGRGATGAESARGMEDVSNRFALLMSDDW